MTKLYGYAYDGSGVELRASVEVLSDNGDTATVRFVDYEPESFLFRDGCSLANPDGTWTVLSSRLSEVGSLAHLASFNFLD